MKAMIGFLFFLLFMAGFFLLFVNDAGFEKYKQDSARYIRDAHKMWPTIRSKAVGDL